jgi:hypothetical protein
VLAPYWMRHEVGDQPIGLCPFDFQAGGGLAGATESAVYRFPVCTLRVGYAPATRPASRLVFVCRRILLHDQ